MFTDREQAWRRGGSRGARPPGPRRELPRAEERLWASSTARVLDRAGRVPGVAPRGPGRPLAGEQVACVRPAGET